MPRREDEGREVERAYDRLAHVYDLVFGALCVPGRKRAVDRLECSPGDRILEIGVGTGYCCGLYPPGVKVVGIDISKEMLRRAAERRDGSENGSWGLARMDAHRLGFADDSFDKVVAFYVISVLPDPVRGVEEMKRVCRPGGDLVVVNHFHHANPLIKKMEKILDPITSWLGWRTTLELDGLVSSTQLDVMDVEPVNLFGYWTLVHARKGSRAVEAATGLA